MGHGAAGRRLVARGLRLARPQVGELGLQRHTPRGAGRSSGCRPPRHHDPPRIRLGALGGLVVAY